MAVAIEGKLTCYCTFPVACTILTYFVSPTFLVMENAQLKATVVHNGDFAVPQMSIVHPTLLLLLVLSRELHKLQPFRLTQVLADLVVVMKEMASVL